MGQNKPKLGETSYTAKTDWNNMSVDWSQLLTTAKGLSGSIVEAWMDRILGRNRKTISQDLVDLCVEVIKAREMELVKASLGMA